MYYTLHLTAAVAAATTAGTAASQLASCPHSRPEYTNVVYRVGEYLHAVSFNIKNGEFSYVCSRKWIKLRYSIKIHIKNIALALMPLKFK